MLDLAAPALYFNRDLSLLAYNRRVLEQARDASRPLLERLRLHVALASNLDELFEIRVAGLQQRAAQRSPDAGRSAAPWLERDGPDGLAPQDALLHVSREAHALVDAQYQLLVFSLLPELEAFGVRIRGRRTWTPGELEWCGRYFGNEIAPLLTPIRLDPAHPFPRVQNRRLGYVVTVRGVDAYGDRHERALATVQMPRGLPTLVPLPDAITGRPYDFVLLSTMIQAFGEELFAGMEVTDCFPFRVTRNSDLDLDEVGPENLRAAVDEELSQRETGDAVRVEVTLECPGDLLRVVQSKLGVPDAGVYRVPGPVDLRRFDAIYQRVERPELKYPALAASTPQALRRGADAFAALRQGPVLLHHPFQSFQPVVDLIRQAADDPHVSAIRQTLYRAVPDSPIVEALVQAAHQGKQVLAVVELRGRTQQDQGFATAQRLERAGARVVHDAAGRRAHAKLLLVTRAEADGPRRYAHLGTGNYHVDPRQPYTDLSLLSADPDLADDVESLFGELSGQPRRAPLRRLWAAPGDLAARLIDLLDRAGAAARQGIPARVAAKLNALGEPSLIEAIYRASRAGARVDLVVRGICALRPGVPGVSERVHVRSVLGRFHEHSRAVWSRIGDEEACFISSADWLPRNLFRRVEACAPIDEPAQRARVREELFELYLADTACAWQLGPDGAWTRCEPAAGEAAVSAQDTLLARHATGAPVG